MKSLTFIELSRRDYKPEGKVFYNGITVFLSSVLQHLAA